MSRAKSILFLTLLPSVIVLVLFAYTYAKKWTQKDEIVATATDGTQINVQSSIPCKARRAALSHGFRQGMAWGREAPY
ncbi:MAG TPA: hypothetical protein PLD60_17975, partial [Leptospiraceae bacterium]|nr:hypothetical protein [Leptospiraceae bacterium]